MIVIANVNQQYFFPRYHELQCDAVADQDLPLNMYFVMMFYRSVNLVILRGWTASYLL